MSPPAAPPRSANELKPVDPALVERFRRDVEALIGLAWEQSQHPPERLLALAVSGGIDSMAMLRLANAAFPGDVVAITMDHGLRPEAASEAALVASVCAQLGIAHHVLVPEAPIEGSSIQMRARQARYAAMSRWADAAGSRHLLTAHHADDQAETLLMRLNRGAGPTGLSGIRPIRFDGPGAILRPLLRWRRAQLRAIVEQTGTPWIEDPSNTDPRHDRTRYRAFLNDQTLLDPGALADAAAHIWEAEEALFTFTQTAWRERWDSLQCTLNPDGMPREILRRVVRMAIEDIRDCEEIAQPAFSLSTNIEALLNALENGQRATQAGVMATPRGDRWLFEPAPPRRSL